MKKIKKLISLLLSAVMVIGLVQVPVNVHGAAAKNSGDYVKELISYYRDYQEKAATDIERVISELKQVDEKKGEAWENIMDYWSVVNADGFANVDTVPENLPEDNSLAIVILGFALNADGTMKGELIGRLQTGLNVANEYPEAYVVVTGGGTASNNPNVTEGELMGEWLLEQGLDESRLIVENRAPDTVGNAKYTYEILKTEYPEVDSVVLVTSDYHIPRGCILYYSKFVLDALETSREPLTIVSNSGYGTGTNGYETIKLQANGVCSVAGVSSSSLPAVKLSKLDSLTVSQEAAYVAGEELDLTVVAGYDSGYSKDVSELATVTGFDASAGAEQTVTVSYTENDITVSVDFKLTDTELSYVDYASKIDGLLGEIDTDGNSYTNETLEILNLAKANAEAVLEKDDPAEDELKGAYETLVKAIEALAEAENIALKKPVTASHNSKEASYITDGDKSSYWSSYEDGNIPIEDSWFTIDLEGVYAVDTVTAVPYFGGNERYYHYDISVSTDNETWTKVAEQRSTADTLETGATFKLEKPVEARYIKVDGVAVSVTDRADINNFHMTEMLVYGDLVQAGEETDTLENLALFGKVTVDSGTKDYVISDGTIANSYWSSANGIANAYCTIELPWEAEVEEFKVVTYYNNTSKWYTYDVLVSTDNENWTSVGKYETEANCGSEGYTITLDEPVNARYVKVKGLNTNNTNLHLVEVQVFGVSENILKNKPVEASHLRDANVKYAAENITDGTIANASYWDSGDVVASVDAWETAEEKDLPYVVIDMEAAYELDTVNVMTYYKADRHYKYRVYTSLDGKEYTLLAEKDGTELSVFSDSFDAEGVKARYLKVLGTYNSANMGFHLLEVRAAGTVIPEGPADYSAVEAAKAKVPADLSIYTVESVVDLKIALAAVKTGLLESDQEDVDAMAEAIEKAVAALEVAEQTPEEPPIEEPEEVDLKKAMSKEIYTDSVTGTTMPYRLFVPKDYDDSKTYPVVVFLHGAGERGSNNESQLLHAIENMFDTHEQMKQSIVIAPQCPGGKRWVETDWTKGNYDSSAIAEEQLATVMNILGTVQGEYSTDNDRIYAVGLSMGGFGTWNLLMNHSDVFAAGIPICGGADPNKADILKDIPIWTFHGTADPTVPYAATAEMYSSIVAAGGNSMKVITYTGGIHNIWNLAVQTEGLIDWLFAQKLSERGEAKAVEAENLFDKNDSDVWMNALSYNGSKLENTTSYANVFTTHKINVKQGDTIYWGGFAQEKYVMELYAEDGTFLKQILFDSTVRVATGSTIQGVGSSNPAEYRYAYKIDEENAGYVRILGNISTMDSFAVYLNLEDALEGWPSMEPAKESVLNGKSILFTGDSITAATRDDYNLSGWAGRIGAEYGMSSTNGGVSGASLSTARGAKRILVQMMSRVENDYDYIIFHGGVNDAMESAPVGEISDSFDVEDFDVTTYAGALEELFYQAYMNFEDTAFGYIINYATPNSTWGGRTPDMSEYFEVGKQICEKWNVPYIDLYSGTVEVDGETLSYSYDILDVNTGENMYNDDAGEVHIGGSGYDLISPYIGAWVETLQVSEMPEGLVAEINDYKGKIVKLFGKLENYAFSIYTEESLEVLEVAAANAEEVIADEDAATEEAKAAYELLVKAVDALKVRENIALKKPATASHNNGNAYKLTDGDLVTYWEGEQNGDIPIAETSFVIDLQGIYALDAITAVPYYAADSRVYHYDISVSTDNENWTKVAEQRSTDYATEAGATFEFEEAVEARYIKVEGVSIYVVERPTLINFHVCEMRAFGTLVEEVEVEEETVTPENLALYTVVTGNAEATGLDYLTDGNSTTNYYSNSNAAIADSYAVIELPGKSLVDHVRVVTYANNTSKWYTWEVLVSDDNENWTSVAAYETESNPGYTGATVKLEEPVEAKFVKIQGLKTNNNNLHLVEIEVYGTMDNIAKGKKVITSSVNGSRAGSYAVDGSLSSYWDAAATVWAEATEKDYPYLIVDLEGMYALDKINVMNYRSASRYYQYDLYTSTDGEEYTLLAKKDDTQNASFNFSFEAEGTTARYIKLVGTFHSANSGYHVNELRATGTLIPEADADYSAVEAAIGKIPEDLSIYTAESVVNLKIAVANVEKGLKESNQSEVDAMAQAIEDMIAALVLKEETPDVPDVPEIPETEVCKIFADVEHDAWYEDSVQYVYDEAIMTGNGDAFMPTEEVTRAMLVETLYKMEGRPKVNKYTEFDTFADLDRGQWWAASVAWALNENVATGDTHNMVFNPEDSVTREQLATFLYRYANYKGIDTTVSEDTVVNDDRISAFAAEAFTWAVDAGIISGIESTDEGGNVVYDLAPQAGASRAELAAVMQRFCEANGQ